MTKTFKPAISAPLTMLKEYCNNKQLDIHRTITEVVYGDTTRYVAKIFIVDDVYGILYGGYAVGQTNAKANKKASLATLEDIVAMTQKIPYTEARKLLNDSPFILVEE